MPVGDLKDLYLHTLKDVYYAEKHILKALPKMAKKANNDQLRKAFEQHEKETQGQVERLEKVFGMLNEKPKGDHCPAIEGLVEEAEELMGEIKDGETLDAAMIAAAQAVEHYEISRYGTLIAWSEQLNMKDAAKTLGETLNEEKQTDAKLTKMAESQVNKKAA
ncbi:MAG TPA: ferritin-like domain-containing protein [Afifellaceae bacterium]|nr:ferritin-like domain-containing protein [Afifellaceae bacterium]